MLYISFVKNKIYRKGQCVQNVVTFRETYIMSADLYNVLVLYNTFLFYSQPFDKRVCREKEASVRRMPPSCKYRSRNRSPQSPYSGKATPTGQPQATE